MTLFCFSLNAQWKFVPVIFIGADWYQTHRIAENDPLRHDIKKERETGRYPFYMKEHVEGNLILGKRPSHTKVNIYFASCMTGYFLVDHLLPKKLKAPFRILVVGVQGYCVIRNYRRGIR